MRLELQVASLRTSASARSRLLYSAVAAKVVVQYCIVTLARQVSEAPISRPFWFSLSKCE